VLQVWQGIISQLEVREEEGSDIWSAEKLARFEVDSGILLPEDYKSFCQIFGSGQFGDGMSISCPMNDEVELEILRSVLEDEFDSELGYRIARDESLNRDSIRELLNTIFSFGGSGNTDIVMWDLRTYCDEDKSYDIYMSRVDTFPGICKVGRSFSEFVETFCLGIRAFNHFPDWTHPNPQNLQRIFTRVPNR